MVQKLLQEEISNEVNVREEDLDLYYKANSDKYVQTDDVADLVNAKQGRHPGHQVLAKCRRGAKNMTVITRCRSDLRCQNRRECGTVFISFHGDNAVDTSNLGGFAGQVAELEPQGAAWFADQLVGTAGRHARQQ